MSYVAVIDCGSSVIKAAVFGRDGTLLSDSSRPTPLDLSSGGSVMDPNEVFRAALGALSDALGASSVEKLEVEAVAVTGQRASVVPVSDTGKYLHPVIGWMDRRCEKDFFDLTSGISDIEYHSVTGLPKAAIFTFAKLLWLQRSMPDIWARSAKFLLMDGVILRGLGCKDLVTDQTNASLTGMLDIKTLRWSDNILKLSGLDVSRMPKIVEPGSKVGELSVKVAEQCGLKPGIPLIASGGDQQCSALGAGVTGAGPVSVTLGTASVATVSLPSCLQDPKIRVFTTRSALSHTWSLEGFQNSAISSLNWLFDGIFGQRGQTGDLFAAAEALSPAAGGLFLPYLGGSASTDWRHALKGSFLNLEMSFGKEHLLRAVMEGISFQNRRILEVFEELGCSAEDLRIAGSGSRVQSWSRLQAAIYGRTVKTLECPGSTGMGAAIMAFCALGEYSSPEEACDKMVRVKNDYVPRHKDVKIYNEIYGEFCDKVELLKR